MLSDYKLITLTDLKKCERELAERKKEIELIFQQDQVGQSPDKKNKMIQILANSHPRKLYSLSENSEKIKFLCENDPTLHKQWSIILKKAGYPFEDITSFNKKINIKNFNILMAAMLFNEFKHYKEDSPAAIELLNKACDLKSYHALVYRLNTHLSKIKECNDVDRIETDVQFASKDAYTLSNVYWAFGSVDAAMALLDIASYLLNKEVYKNRFEHFLQSIDTSDSFWESHFKSKDLPYPIQILNTGLEILYTTQIISQFPESKIIANAISAGKGELAGYSSFNTPEELQKSVIGLLERLNIPSPQKLCDKAYQVALNSVKQQYPGRISS